MKRLIATLLAFCLLVGLLPAIPLKAQAADSSSRAITWLWTDFAAEGFASGSGSESDPYLIATAEQLAYLAVQVNAGNSYEGQYFALVEDLELRDYLWVPIGAKESTPFKGNFRGNSFTITRMTIENDSVPDAYCGLFGYFPSGSISDLSLEWVDISLDENPTVCYIGCLIGYGIGATYVDVQGNIDLCNYSSGGNHIYCGGLVGKSTRTTQNSSYSGFINVICLGGASVGGIHGVVSYNHTGVLTRNCHTSGEITVSSDYDENGSPTDTNNMYVGGLIGSDAQGIANCYSTMSIAASGFNGSVGGLVGYLMHDLRNSYATGLVYHYPVYVSNQSSHAYAGGLVGSWGAGNITNCFSMNELVSCCHADNMRETYAGRLVGYHQQEVVGSVTNSYVTGTTIVERQIFKDGGDCDADSYPVSNSINTTYSAPETDTFTYSAKFVTDTLGWDPYIKYYNNMYLSNQVWMITDSQPFLFMSSTSSLTIRYWDPSNTIFKVDLSYLKTDSQYSVTSPELLGGTPDEQVVTGTLYRDTFLDVHYTHQHIPGPEATCVEAQTCTLCGLVLTEALPHNYAVNGIVAPKCAENGHTVFICESCNHTMIGDFVAPLGHNLDADNFCTRCGMAFEAPLRDFRVHVLDQENNKPLAGVCVQLGSSTVITDTTGIANHQLSSEEAMVLSVTAEGYPNYEVTDFLPGELPDAYVFITSSDTGIYDARCNNKDVLQSSAQINALSPTLEAKIVVKGRSKTTISHYELVQGNAILASSSDGVFAVRNLDFHRDEPVYALMYTTGPEGANVFRQKLNISVVSFNLEAGTDWSKLLPFSAGVNLSFPGGTPILEGLNFKLPAHALGENGYVKVQVGNEKVMVTFGDKSDQDEKEEDIDNKSKTQLLRKMRDDWVKKNNPRAWPEGKKENEVEASFGLVMDFSGGQITSVYGQVNVAYNLSYANGKTFLVFGFIPVYAEISASFNGQLQISELGYDLKNAQVLIPDVELTLQGQLTLQEGLGCSVISAGVYGTAGASLIMGFEDLQAYIAYRIYGEIGLYARLDLFFWKAMEYRLPLIHGEFSGSAGNYARRAMYSLEGYQTVSRDYLKNRSAWMPYGTRSSYASPTLTMQTSSYSAIEPKVVTAGNTTMMVFVDDDGSKGLNYQHLYYSLYQADSGLWSKPKKVDSNSLCDLEFDVCTDGQKIWIVYSQMEAVTDDNQDNYEDLLRTVDLSTAVYDPETGEFTFDTLTDDNTFDTLPQIAATKDGIRAAWVSNATNDPFSQNANNRIFSALYQSNHWSSNVALTGSGATVVSMDLGMLNDTTYIATLVDVDCDLSTIDDRQPVLTHMDGTVTNIATPMSTNDSMQFGTVHGQQCLLWYRDRNLYSIHTPTNTPTALFDEAVEGLSSDYRLITLADNQQAIIYTTPQRWTDENGIEQSGSNLQAIFCLSGHWYDPIPLTQPEANRYVDAFDVQVVDGKLLMPYISTEATVGNEIERVADFRCIYTEAPRDLVTGTVLYLPSSLLDNETPEIKVPFTNHSLFPVSEVTYRVSDSNGNLVIEGTANAPADAGQEGWVTILLPHSSLQSGNSYQVTILPQGWSDENPDNNTADLNIWYSDLSVAIDQILLDTQQVQYAVTNDGNALGSGKFEIILPEANGAETVLHSSIIEGLEPGKTIHGMLQLDEALSNNNRYLLARITATTPELYDFNNEASLTLRPLIRESSTEVPETETVEQSPHLSTSHVLYDKRDGGSVTVTITKNGWSFDSIAGASQGAVETSGNSLVLTAGWLQGLTPGYKNLILGFGKDQQHLKLNLLVEVIDTRNTIPSITAEDQVFQYTGYAPVLGSDILYSTNSQGAVTASYCLNKGTWTPGLPTEAGSYQIWLQVAADSQNNLTEGSCYFTLEITKQNRAISVPIVTTLENGSYRFEGAVPTAGVEDGVITYGYSTDNDPSTVAQWDSIGLIPPSEHSADYYLFARITEGTNYHDVYSLGQPLSIHIHTYEALVTPPSCEAPGFTTYACSVCGDHYTDGYLDALGHSFDEGVITTKPTCTLEGVMTFTCGICGDQYTTTLQAAGHQYESLVTPPGCENEGFTTHTCSVCGDSYTDGNLDALGHSFDEGAITTRPTCTTEGVMTFTCGSCGEQYTTTLPASGHRYDSMVVLPDCEKSGFTSHSCFDCGDSYTDNIIPAPGHAYKDGFCQSCGTLEPGYASFSGSVQSYGDASEIVAVELIPLGASEVAYSQLLFDGNTDFRFVGVVPGDYTLSIHKKNHVSRYFTVSIQAGEENAVQIWKICLLGDVSGDGRVNVGDVAQLYSHIRKTTVITDEYSLACADVTGDSRWNVGDTATLYSHVKNTKKLY